MWKQDVMLWSLYLIQVSNSLSGQWDTGLSHGVLAVPAWRDVGDGKRWFGFFFPPIQIIFSSVCKNYGKWLFTGKNGVSVEGQTECRISSWRGPSLCSVVGNLMQ